MASPRKAPSPDLAARFRAADRAIRSRLESRDTLLGLMRDVNATLEPREIAAALLERAASWLPAGAWALVSADPTGQLSLLAQRGRPIEGEDPWFAVARWVMRTNDMLFSADLRHEPRAAGDLAASAVAFPLMARGVCAAVLMGLDTTPSSREPRLPPATTRALATLLEPAGAALDKVLLLQRAEALSVTDDLTHLYNSRYLNQVLRRESKRATRGGRPLSVLFVDLDGFKGINDTHGHLYGSRALVEAAAVIRGGARETDIVARFGGDEFALVLPDTGASGALAVAERVRERIATHDFLAAEGLTVRLTASVGIATLPDAASTADGLVQAADAAMYHVKALGKNGIQSAPDRSDK